MSLPTLKYRTRLSSRLMLNDPLYRINTTNFGHGKLSPYQQRVRALDLLSISVIITPLKATLLHHSSPFFHDVGDSSGLFRLRPAEPQPPGGACPLARRTLPMTGHGVTRFVW
jgi:hypothetical protein